MIPTIPRLQSLLFLTAVVGAIALNAWLIQNPAFGFLLFLLWIGSVSRGAGNIVLPKADPIAQRFAGAISVLAGFSLLGSLVYYLGTVQIPEVFTCLVLVSAAAWWGEHKKSSKEDEKESVYAEKGVSQKSWTALLAIGGIILCLFAWWQTLLPLSVTESIRSPWLVVPLGILLAPAISGALLYGLLSGVRTKLTPLLLAVTLFSCIAIAITIYPLGFGFDPFLHEATVSHILTFGSITPKPLYYIGSYALEFGGALLFSWPLPLLDHLLVPVLGAFILTGSAWIGLKDQKNISGVALLALFLFPLGTLITSTPQSLAYVITGSLVFFSLLPNPSKKLLLLLTGFSLLIHPLAGIPCALYTLILLLQGGKISTKKHLLTLGGFLLLTIAVPGVFLLQAAFGHLSIHFDLQNLSWNHLGLTFFAENNFHPTLDGLYLVIQNNWWLIFLLACYGWYTQRKSSQERERDGLPFFAAIACFASFLFMHSLSFDFLIEYERADYADRLLTLFIIFLLPHAAFAIARIDASLREHNNVAGRAAFAGILGCVIAAQTYGAYPRHDNYARSAGFNVGQDEFSAVTTIHERPEAKKDYIVLSDQSLSAAAVETYGFAKYYHGDMFYYPIPTGGVLYQFYLDMTKEPTRETMEKAMDAAGVSEGFFAVNTYWWDADRIIEHAKGVADDWFAVGNVTVFIFHK